MPGCPWTPTATAPTTTSCWRRSCSSSSPWAICADPAEIHFDENTVVEVADFENEEYYVEGERLTEESAQRLAAEMLERVRAKNLRPGGKSLSGGNKHSPVVQVRVSELTRDKLQAIANARGMSVSKLSRKVLDEFVKRETLEH